MGRWLTLEGQMTHKSGITLHNNYTKLYKQQTFGHDVSPFDRM